jgi:hypothetical protein
LSPFLALIDTRNSVIGVAPALTVFRLPIVLTDYLAVPPRFVKGMRGPSLGGSLTTFHQHPAQRIVALHGTFEYLLVRIGALLELAEGRKGSTIPWDEWKDHVVIPSLDVPPIEIVDVWTSGSRFYVLYSRLRSKVAHMRVWDFSLRGRVKYSSNRANERLGGVGYLLSTGVEVEVPWDRLADACGMHDSIAFSGVSVFTPVLVGSVTKWKFLRRCLVGPWRR